MSMTATALAAEINNDPKALGYAVPKLAGSDIGVANIVNSTYAGVGTVWRTNVKAAEILAAITLSEINATFSATNWAALSAILTPLVVDASNAVIRGWFVTLFPSALYPTTNAALVTTAKVAAPSRAEELWGAGTLISATDVAHALGRG